MGEVLAVEVKSEVEATPKLTTRQARFVEEYMLDYNSTQAAIRAGYSQTYARQQGWQLLQLPHVKEAVQLATEEQAQQLEITKQEIINELKTIGFDKEEKTRDRIEALKLLGRHLGMFGSDTQLNLNTGDYKIEIVEVGRSVDIR